MKILPKSSTRDQQRQSNPKPFDLKSNVLSTQSCAPYSHVHMPWPHGPYSHAHMFGYLFLTHMFTSSAACSLLTCSHALAHGPY